MRTIGHFLFACLASAALLVCGDVLRGLFALLGRPWLGFSLVKEGFVNSIGVSSRFHMWDRILTVDGVPVSSAAEIVSHARTAGTPVAYEVEHLHGGLERIVVETGLFTFSDLVRSQSGLAFLGTIFVIISVFFYFLRPGTKEAWAFFGLFAAIGIASVSVVDMTMLWHWPPLYPMVAPSLGALGIVLVGVISGESARKPTRIVTALCFAVSVTIAVLLVTNQRDIHAYVAIDRLFYIWMAASAAGGLGLLAFAYFRSASADRRARMRHIMWMWPLGVGIPILNLLVGHTFHGAQTSLIWNVFLILVPLSTADAIVRHDLLVLNNQARRVVGGITIAVVVGMALGFLLWNAVDYFALDDAAAMVALAAVLFAIAAPLTYQLQSNVEARLRSRRYDFGRLVAQFGAHASTATHIAEVVDQLRDTLGASIAPATFEVYRFDRGQRVLRPLVAPAAPLVAVDRAVERWLTQVVPIVVDDQSRVPAPIEASLGHVSLAVRLAVANEAVGLLVVTARAQRVPYEDTDVSFVAALAGPLAAALVNAVAFEEVERLNRELEGRVAARTEELEQKNRQLALLDRRKDELVATVSHDFRSPLAVIRGNVQTMMHDLPILDRHELMQLLQAVDRQEHRLTALCTNLLDLARLKQATGARRDPVDVAQLARRLVDDLANRARAKGIVLDLRVEPDAPHWVQGDVDRLEQVIQNLVDNAIKFTPPDGRVGVRLAHAAPGRLLVEVTDSGCGVPADAVTRIFEPFFQVPSNTYAGQGSGLGLAIVKAVVEAHDGEVSVTTNDGGTSFSILLNGGNAVKIHVLVVDDERDFREFLQQSFVRAGYDVTAAVNGQEALAILRSTAPGGDVRPVDIIVSDVMMPVLDGHGFLRAVRADPATAELPFMFLTARGESADKLEGFRGGADDYLTKPFDREELLARMHVLARRARVTRGLRTVLSDRPAPGTPAETPPLGDLYAKVAVWEQRFPRLAAIRRDSIVGASSRTLQLLRDILVSAPTRDAVLIIGETGTGKTGVAEALHGLGPAPNKPFKVINCAELSAADPAITLGKLFGYGKGSGLSHVPKDGQPGLLEEADGGTLFLDEVHRLPPSVQGQLLLAVERRPFSPAVGKGDPKTVNVKFVFATNVDLKALAQAGGFPFDLYQRIAQCQIRVPPLSERREDIVPLAEHFLDEWRVDSGIDNATFAPSLLQLIHARNYPGNIRQLRNFIRSIAGAAMFEQDSVLAREHIPSTWDADDAAPVPDIAPAVAPHVPAPRREAPPVPSAPPVVPVSTSVEVPWNEIDMRDLIALRRHRFRIIDAEQELGYSEKSRTLTNHLRSLCFKALDHARFDVAAAARLIVGRDDEALLDRAVDRIESYLAIVERHVAAHTVETLYNNVQVDYRRYVDEAVQQARVRQHAAHTAPSA